MHVASPAAPLQMAAPPRPEHLAGPGGFLPAGMHPDEVQAHLQQIADAGALDATLTEIHAALDASQGAPYLAQQQAPDLQAVHQALDALDTSALPRSQREDIQAMLVRIDAHLADIAGTDIQVPGGGLQAHEDAGGHLIERHVGKTEGWLIDRVRSQNISAASSFRDLPEAEYFVAQTIAEHQQAVDSWRDGAGGRRLVIDASFDASTGISVTRNADAAQDVFSVRLVLERSDRLDIGYRIITGYPSTP